MDENYFVRPLKVAVWSVGCAIAGGTLYATYTFYWNKAQPSLAVGDTVESSRPGNGDSQVDDTQQLEIQICHSHLINFLDREIQRHGSDEFESIQETVKSYIGRGNALACTNIRDIINQLELQGKVGPGNYGFLKDNVLKASGFSHYVAMNEIANIEKKINDIVNSPPETMESSVPDSLEGPPSRAEAVQDILILYADTDDARNEAIDFKKNMKAIMPSATVCIWDEVGFGNLQEFQALDKAVHMFRYVFILMTSNLPGDDDPLHIFKGHALLTHFTKERQSRTVTVWFSSNRSGYPISLSSLVGQNYFLLKSEEEDIRKIFVDGFKNLILRGRKCIRMES